jgi:hypothetical protein
MKYDDAKFVLAVAASYDNRAPSQAVATAWAFDLGDIARDDAVAAVRGHYKANPDTWIKPGHVVEIVKHARSAGLARSSRIENAAIEALDPDDPEYDRKHLEAIQDARHAAAERPEVIPARIALPQGERSPEDRVERNARGAALAKAAVKPFPGAVREDAPDIPENLRKAREAAVDYRADQARRDSALKLGATGGRLLSQINQNRRNTA